MITPNVISSLSCRERVQRTGDGQRGEPRAAVRARRSFAVERQRLLPRRLARCSALLSVSSPGEISAVSHVTPRELHISIMRRCHDGFMVHVGPVMDGTDVHSSRSLAVFALRR